jgi:hypothetical protein
MLRGVRGLAVEIYVSTWSESRIGPDGRKRGRDGRETIVRVYCPIPRSYRTKPLEESAADNQSRNSFADVRAVVKSGTG